MYRTLYRFQDDVKFDDAIEELAVLKTQLQACCDCVNYFMVFVCNSSNSAGWILIDVELKVLI